MIYVLHKCISVLELGKYKYELFTWQYIGNCKTISNIFFLNATSIYAIHISISIQSDIFKLLEQEMYMQERIETASTSLHIEGPSEHGVQRAQFASLLCILTMSLYRVVGIVFTNSFPVFYFN